MSTNVIHTKRFRARLKRLARRFPPALTEVDALTEELRQGERPGDLYRGVGHVVYRVRRTNPSGGSGKSGGFRITYYVHDADTVALLAIAQRKDSGYLSRYEIDQLLQDAVCLDLLLRRSLYPKCPKPVSAVNVYVTLSSTEET